MKQPVKNKKQDPLAEAKGEYTNAMRAYADAVDGYGDAMVAEPLLSAFKKLKKAHKQFLKLGKAKAKTETKAIEKTKATTKTKDKKSGK
jgi:hypothetical protein